MHTKPIDMRKSFDALFGIVSADFGRDVRAGGLYGASIGATIVANKFGFHLPYYRLQDIFGSCGWTPARSTIDHITSEVDFVLSPIQP